MKKVHYIDYIEAAQNFFRYVTIFVTDRAQKTSLTKLVLKSSVLKQCLPNSHIYGIQSLEFEPLC
jgi:phosphopantetheine adenylyltransferase